ncbi:MAG: two-component system sensor histidine kinase CreC, partial [Pseudomonadales bacterium]
MSLSSRIFLAYFAILGIAVYMVLNVFMSEIKPGVRQSTEDTLVDMANLLAEVVRDDTRDNTLASSEFGDQITRFLNRTYRAKIFDVEKYDSSLRIYITNKHGIVQYDSAGLALGADYSQWNDVYLTLRGKYGARSTPATADDPSTTVMHVAAPIREGDEIIGAITVAKTNRSLQPFIDMARQKIELRGIALILLSVIAALILSYWLTASIRKLTRYADDTASGARLAPPKLSERELVKLAQAMDNMREQLEGKEYVEKYVHALTHELKSPVSAIKGAAEIIDEQMPAAERARFLHNIHTQSERLEVMINKMLELAKLEKCEVLDEAQQVDLGELIGQLKQAKKVQLEEKAITLKLEVPTQVSLNADAFLLLQALDNLVQNAIDFSPQGGTIALTVTVRERIVIQVKDWGSGIPQYAQDKIFERFYS